MRIKGKRQEDTFKRKFFLLRPSQPTSRLFAENYESSRDSVEEPFCPLSKDEILSNQGNKSRLPFAINPGMLKAQSKAMGPPQCHLAYEIASPTLVPRSTIIQGFFRNFHQNRAIDNWSSKCPDEKRQAFLTEFSARQLIRAVKL